MTLSRGTLPAVTTVSRYCDTRYSSRRLSAVRRDVCVTDEDGASKEKEELLVDSMVSSAAYVSQVAGKLEL